MDQLQPWLRPYVEYALALHKQITAQQDIRGRGTSPTVTSTYRSIGEQEDLYANRANNAYPVNRPGDSAHNYGLAFDSSVPAEQRPLWTAVRQYVGFRVPDNDVVHGEVPGWRDLVTRAGYKLP